MTSTRFNLIAGIAGADDWEYDPFGTTMELFFAVAEVLNMSDIADDVTPVPFKHWQYRPAPFAIPALEDVAARADHFSEGEFSDDYSYATVMLAAALNDETITQADLVYVGEVLHKYCVILESTGRTY